MLKNDISHFPKIEKPTSCLYIYFPKKIRTKKCNSMTIQPQNMLELQQMTLMNLCADKELFKKELVKSIKWLPSYEIFQLRKWLKNNYSSTHGDVISEVFNFLT